MHQVVHPVHGRRAYSFGVLFTLYLLSQMDRQILAILIIPIQRDLHLDDFQSGLLLGPAFGVIYAVLGVPFGVLADRVSRARLIFGGAALWGIGTAACGLAGSFWQIALGRTCIGTGEAALTPASHPTLAALFGNKRSATAISAHNVAAPLGSALAMFVGGTLIVYLGAGINLPVIGHLRNWQVIFVGLGLTTMVVSLFALGIPAQANARHAAAPMRAFLAHVGTHRRIIGAFTLGATGLVVISGSLAALLPTYLNRRFGWELHEIGSALGLLILAFGVPGHLFSGWCVDRLHARGYRDANLRYAEIALAIGGSLTLLALLAPSGMLCLALLAVFFFATFPSMGLCSAGLQIITPPALRGRITALFMLVINLVGLGLGPTLVGFISKYVFADPARIGEALLIVIGGAIPLTLLALHSGRRAMRESAWGEEP